MIKYGIKNMKNIKFDMVDSSTWPKNIMGIYAIHSKTTNKIYVGMTNHKRGFSGRWFDHREKLRRNKHDNIYMQNSYNKNGEGDFYFSILETSESNITKNDLQEIEYKWIKDLKSLYFENGWNIDYYDRYNKRKSNYRPSYKDKSINFEFIDPSGNIVRGNNLKKFCEDNNLYPGNMNKVFHGKQYSYKGYRSINTEFHKKTKLYKLISPDGILHEFTSAKKFAKENNLHNSNLYLALNYKAQTCQGWYVPDVLEKMTCSRDHPAVIKKVINLKTFKIHEFKNMDRFCKKYNLEKLKLNKILYKSSDCTFRYDDWAYIDTEIKAVKKNNIIYRFIWATEINKLLNVSSSTISNLWKDNKKSRNGIERCDLPPLEIVKEDF